MTADMMPPDLSRTRRSLQFSAENPDGARGRACQWEPNPRDDYLRHSGPATELGRGFKVRPYVQVAAGETLTLADVHGQGQITQIYLTTDAPRMSELRLRCYWDGHAEPAVDAPLGLFFGIGHDERPHTVISNPVIVGPSRGCACYWPMPFASRAVITLTNESAAEVSVVAYRVSCVLEEGPGVSTSRFHAHATKTTTGPGTPEHQIIAIPGRGAYVGTSLAWLAMEPGWWGEGEVKFTFGDDALPTIVDNGAEDYFGGAWGFGRDALYPNTHGTFSEESFNAPFVGCPMIESDDQHVRRISLYRWHIPDPVYFDQDLRVVVQALGWGPNKKYRVRADRIESVAYWYTG